MKKLLILISIVAASMFATARAATGDVTTIVNETLKTGSTLTDAEAYSWGSEIQGMLTTYGMSVTNNSAKNPYENREFVTFTNPIGNSTEEISINYNLYRVNSLTGSGLANHTISFFNNNDELVFSITESIGDNWAYPTDLVIAKEDNKSETISLTNSVTAKTVYCPFEMTIKFHDTTATIITGGNSYDAYTSTEGIKYIKLSAGGRDDAGRGLNISDFVIKTTEVAKAEFTTYTLKYVDESGYTIKDNVEVSGEVGAEISISESQKDVIYNDDKSKKYIFVSDDAEGKTVAADGSSVVTLTFRTAATYNYTVKANVDDVIIAIGSVLEGESVTVPFSRYIIAEDNVVWSNIVATDGKSPYTKTITPDKDGYETVINYTKTDMTDGIFFKEAENFTAEEGWTNVDGARNTGGRASNANGAYATNGSATLYTLKPGNYNFKFATICDGGYNTLTLKAGDLEILSGAANTNLQEYSTNESVPISSETELTIEGTNNRNVLDYILITGEVAKPVTGVTINDKDGNPIETLELTENETYQLSALIEPENADVQTATWTSDNEEVATVSATGLVTALAEGTATITATAGEKSAVCALTVKPDLTNVTALSLDKTEATVAVGDELELTATVEPAAANVAWTSDNEEVATVEAGKVTAIAAGKATITAKAGSLTATCEVTVTVPVSGVTLSMDKITVDKGDEFTLTATVAPENATDKTVTWSSDNTDVATVDADGKVRAVAAGEAVITAKAGEETASCTVTVDESVATDGVIVKMTYVYKDEPNKAYGKILAGENAMSGFNTVSNDIVGFPSTNWNVTYITYLQVDASAIEDKYITSATLTFEGSGSADSKRTTSWGVGYNNSVWSSTMTYESANKSITKLDVEKGGESKSATSFENYSFDITEAINNAEGRIVTILVYETAAGGGYIKNPTVTIQSTNELVYNVTFAEKNEVEGVKVSVNVNDSDKDATNGITLSNGTYTYTATAPHYKDYSGEFTVADADLDVEFEMTKKELWSYTVNAVDANGELLKELSTGEAYEGESATVVYSHYILAADGKVWKKDASGGNDKKQFDYTFTPETNNYVASLEYNETDITDGLYFVEGEDIEGMTVVTGSNANIRCSNAAGGHSAEAVTVYTLKPGTYKVHMGVFGNSGATFIVKSGEEPILTAETKGYWYEAVSEEFTIDEGTDLTFEGTASNKPLDYILITGKEGIDVKEISLDKTEATMTVGETLDLVATVTPSNATDATVTWTSDNTEVATVENGKVTALKRGQAKITAKAGGKEASCSVKVYPKLGDADLDGTVDINDAVDITNYVVGKKVVEADKLDEYKKAANANGDAEGRITFADASATVTLALTQEAPEAAAQSRIAAYEDESTDALVVGRASSSSFGTVVPVALDNTEEYVALQADIFLPEGMNVDVKAGSRAADTHTFMTNKFADNHIRVALFNFSGTAFADTDAPILEIVTDSFISASDVEINYIIASDADANKYMLASRSAEATAVAAIGLDANAPVKVFDMNGIFVSDSMVGLQQGIYIVRQGDQAKKVNIR